MNFESFVQLTKIDASKHQVWGIATSEVKDNSGEIMHYEKSKPNFQKWSDGFAKASGNKSLGNLRSMHQPIATGKIISMELRDNTKEIFIGAEVIDEQEWKKVEKGVYTGFSIGGKYGETWTENNARYYEAIPAEISLVDKPCNSDAQFEFVRVDGVSELHKFDEFTKHYGPGDHPSGSSQDVHGGGTGTQHRVGDEEPMDFNDQVDYFDQSKGDKGLAFRVVEDRGDRVLIASTHENGKPITDNGLGYSTVVKKNELARIGEGHPAYTPDRVSGASIREKIKAGGAYIELGSRSVKNYLTLGTDGKVTITPKNGEAREFESMTDMLDTTGKNYGAILFDQPKTKVKKSTTGVVNGSTGKTWTPEEVAKQVIIAQNAGTSPEHLKILADVLLGTTKKMESIMENDMNKFFPPKKEEESAAEDSTDTTPESASEDNGSSGGFGSEGKKPKGKAPVQPSGPSEGGDALAMIEAGLKDGTIAPSLAAQLKAAITGEESSEQTEKIPSNETGLATPPIGTPDAGTAPGLPGQAQEKELRATMLSLLEELGLVERTDAGAMKLEPTGMLLKGDIDADLMKHNDQLIKRMDDNNRALIGDLAKLAVAIEELEKRVKTVSGLGPVMREIGTQGTGVIQALQKAEQFRNLLATATDPAEREQLQLELTRLEILSGYTK